MAELPPVSAPDIVIVVLDVCGREFLGPGAPKSFSQTTYLKPPFKAMVLLQGFWQDALV
jgi:hypothetical protein